MTHLFSVPTHYPFTSLFYSAIGFLIGFFVGKFLERRKARQ